MPDDPHPAVILAAGVVLFALETVANVALGVWVLLESARDWLGGRDG